MVIINITGGMNKMKNKFLLMLCILVISLLPATSVAAKASAIVINGKDGKVYEYNYFNLKASAVEAKLGDTTGGALYNDFISRKDSVKAYFDDTRQVYVNSDTVFKAAVNAALVGNPFNFETFMEDKTTPTITIKPVEVTNDNGVIKTNDQYIDTAIDFTSIECSNPIDNCNTVVTFRINPYLLTDLENYTVTVRGKTAIYNTTTGLFSVTLDGKLVPTDFTISDFVVIRKSVSTATISKMDNITATVAQNGFYTLPTTVSAIMSDGSTQRVSVTWDKQADTSQAGTFTYTGTVSGYSGNVVATLTVNTSNNLVVTFKDKNLEQAVRNTINKSTGDIYKSDVEKITELNVECYPVQDLSGIENLSNLQQFSLTGNNVSDISALKGLTNLQTLNLGGNQISDISPLEGLFNLQELNLTINKISDISVLKGLTNLQTLELADNNITDISALKGLINLQTLKLADNNIIDVSSLKWLTDLQYLDLSYNPVSDVDIQTLKNSLPKCNIYHSTECAEKPNIYLYPEKTEDLSVYVTPKGKITKSIPEYNEGWKVTVDPSGKIDNTYDFLFYEASLNYRFTLNKGWIVNKDNFNEEMNNILTSIGLNSKEKADFIEYWSKRLNWQNNRYVAYYLDPKEINEAIKLNFSKEPDSILRVFFYFVPLKDNDNLEIKKPEIQQFKRNGFTVVEWGGICK
jgi:Leucine-rich repeat (LRR) protein